MIFPTTTKSKAIVVYLDAASRTLRVQAEFGCVKGCVMLVRTTADTILTVVTSNMQRVSGFSACLCE